MTAPEFTALLALCKLPEEYKTMAIQAIMWRMSFVEMSAADKWDRTTIKRKLRDEIIPEMERMIPRLHELHTSA